MSIENKIRIDHLQESSLSYVALRLLGKSDVVWNSKLQSLNSDKSAKNLLIVAPDTKTAEILISDLNSINEYLTQLTDTAKIKICPFLPWEVLPFDGLSPAQELSCIRINTLYEMLNDSPSIVVATIDSLMQKFVAPEILLQNSISLTVGQNLNRDDLISQLDILGYQRNSVVEEHGQVAIRGAVVDIFPPGSDKPIRLELFSDQLESIRVFNPENQRSVKNLDSLTLLPSREFFLPQETDRNSKDIFGLTFEEALANLRNRSDSLEIPHRIFSELEEVIRNRTSWPGLEQLQVLLTTKMVTLFDYLKPNDLVFSHHPLDLQTQADSFELLLKERTEKVSKEQRIFVEPKSFYLTSNEVNNLIRSRTDIFIDQLVDFSTQNDSDIITDLKLEPHRQLIAALVSAKNSELPFQPLIDLLKSSEKEDLSVGIFVTNKQRRERISRLLNEYSIEHVAVSDALPFPGFTTEKLKNNSRVYLLEGSLSSGFNNVQEKFKLLIDREIFPELSVVRKSKSGKHLQRFLNTLSQLHENDFIVHVDHGIGIYRGLKEIKVAGRVGDFIALEYAEQSKLFLPVEQIGKLQKYVAGESSLPNLSKLGTKQWEQQKKKIKQNVAELAGQLLNLYAQREIANGFSFGEIDAQDIEFASTFPFEETPDQERAINEVLESMGSGKAMDRLVCGDVGYGKTEVAMRAAFKAASKGRQTALLVPTTVLADQHFNSFKERFANTAMQIGCLSRFFSPVENKATIEKLNSGQIDIVIGTHRLLQKDILFKDLGLIIIDEEHRFGVKHKEKLKQMRKNADVLTLTATPIPRTLHMSLLGIRDLSIIATPPYDRQAISTYLSSDDENIVREAVLRELKRSGQVFFVHNRVQNIASVCDQLRDLVPEAKIEFAHGQMKQGQLEDIIHKFVNREFDVLVSTTIVESGLDISNANTIIIKHADRFGLAELYQLRGRVGRSSRRAYAYLLVTDLKTVSADAKKRLKVLQSLDDLGMGFQLAIQDMEIRGAGNLLGKDQSGSINLIGFELYTQILKDAISEIKRSGKTESLHETIIIDPEINIGFPAHIPSFYIPDVSERLILYQRLVQIENEFEAEEISEEISDRFGQMPEEVSQLFELMIFRALLKQAKATSAQLKTNYLMLGFHPQANLNIEKLLKIISVSNGELALTPAMTLKVKIDTEKLSSPYDLTKRIKSLFIEMGLAN